MSWAGDKCCPVKHFAIDIDLALQSAQVVVIRFDFIAMDMPVDASEIKPH